MLHRWMRQGVACCLVRLHGHKSAHDEWIEWIWTEELLGSSSRSCWGAAPPSRAAAAPLPGEGGRGEQLAVPAAPPPLQPLGSLQPVSCSGWRRSLPARLAGTAPVRAPPGTVPVTVAPGQLGAWGGPATWYAGGGAASLILTCRATPGPRPSPSRRRSARWKSTHLSTLRRRGRLAVQGGTSGCPLLPPESESESLLAVCQPG
jgi:hypothetical protein